jgi:gliding motility-associated-like protein
VGCEPLAVQFSSIATLKSGKNGVGISKYDWDFGDGSTHGILPDPKHVYTVLNGQITQQYNVKLTVTSDSGCVSDTMNPNWITVYATPKPAITANPEITTIALPQIQFDVNEALSKGIDFTDPKTTYHWNFGDSSKVYSTIKNPLYTYLDTGKFKVLVQVKSRGCVGDSSLEVYIQPELIIYIPNVFTPGGMHGNGKGHDANYFDENVNNSFQPVISAYESFEMSIYNRWGELMYTTYNPKKGWDGRFEDRRPKQDVYVYVIKATGYSGKLYTFTGTVTLLY